MSTSLIFKPFLYSTQRSPELGEQIPWVCLGAGLLGPESVHGWRKFPTVAGKLPCLTASLHHGHLRGVWLLPCLLRASEASVAGQQGKPRGAGGLSWLGFGHTQALLAYASMERHLQVQHIQGEKLKNSELWDAHDPAEITLGRPKRRLRWLRGGRGLWASWQLQCNPQDTPDGRRARLPGEVETSRSLESLCWMMVSWYTQVEGCLAKANTWKTVFLKQTRVKGCLDMADTWKDSWWRSINMTSQTVGDKHWALVWFAPPHYSSLKARVYWFALHNVVERNLPKNFLWSSCGSLLILWPRLRQVGEPGGFFRVELQLPGVCLMKGLDCSCWFMPGVCLPRGLVCAAKLCLMFANGLNCCPRSLSSLPKNYCWTGPLPHILITFLFYFLCWVVG
jgi:hypothetical protein